MADVEQTQKMIPLITCESSFGQNVSMLVFGVDVLDVDFGVQINSIKQPVKCNSVSPGNMSRCRASSLVNQMGNVELFELCETIPKVQCSECLPLLGIKE